MTISRDEALKAVDNIFNYCEEIDNSLPENERSGYKMLPDIQKIRKYIIENTRQHGEWIKHFDGNEWVLYCTSCNEQYYEEDLYMGGNEFSNFCPCCGSDNRPKEGDEK